jgi:outer membrane murein-binding lipoprotein Lpp
MSFFRMLMIAAFVLGTVSLVSCKKETAEDKAKSGISKLGDAGNQAAEDAKKAADEATK